MGSVRLGAHVDEERVDPLGALAVDGDDRDGQLPDIGVRGRAREGERLAVEGEPAGQRRAVLAQRGDLEGVAEVGVGVEEHGRVELEREALVDRRHLVGDRVGHRGHVVDVLDREREAAGRLVTHRVGGHDGDDRAAGVGVARDAAERAGRGVERRATRERAAVGADGAQREAVAEVDVGVREGVLGERQQERLVLDHGLVGEAADQRRRVVDVDHPQREVGGGGCAGLVRGRDGHHQGAHVRVAGHAPEGAVAAGEREPGRQRRRRPSGWRRRRGRHRSRAR